MATTKKLINLYGDAEKAATVYAKAYNEGGHKKSELKALKKAASSAMDKYNLELSKDVYKQWAKEGDPVKTAIRLHVIPGARRLEFKTDEDDYMVVNIRDAVYYVNLPQMHATLGADVFSNVGCREGETWFELAQNVALYIAMNLSERIGDSSSFVYDISDVAKKVGLPEDVDPLSDEGAVNALQKLFDAILYIDNVDNPGTNLIHTVLKKDSKGRFYSTEWQTIRESMTGSAGVNQVRICNVGVFTHYILNAMNGLLTNGSFGLSTEAYDSPVKAKRSAKKSK